MPASREASAGVAGCWARWLGLLMGQKTVAAEPTVGRLKARPATAAKRQQALLAATGLLAAHSCLSPLAAQAAAARPPTCASLQPRLTGGEKALPAALPRAIGLDQRPCRCLRRLNASLSLLRRTERSVVTFSYQVTVLTYLLSHTWHTTIASTLPRRSAPLLRGGARVHRDGKLARRLRLAGSREQR